MIYTDTGIVIFSQSFRESDKIVSIYTREHGRINVRFPSVCKSVGKMKALSELFVCGEYRIYVKKGGVIGTVTGGKVYSVFPKIRYDLKKTQIAMQLCELIMRFTPPYQSNEEKYNLLYQGLLTLNSLVVDSSFLPAFILRLMRLAGYGLDRPVLKISDEFWNKIHTEDFSKLQTSNPEDLISLSKCQIICHRFLDQYLTYPLNTAKNFKLDEDELNHYDAFTPVSLELTKSPVEINS